MRNKTIAFCVRKDYQSAPGGDMVQMEAWAKILQELDNRVIVLSGAVHAEDLTEADCVFIWHLERLHESFQPWQVARSLQKPIFLVPTCWHSLAGITLWRSCKEQLSWLLRLLLGKNSASLKTVFFSNWRSCRKRLLMESSMLLVNSESEKKYLVGEGANPETIIVIPNTINLAEIAAIPEIPWEQRHGIVCVGHFCPRKNQYELIQALQDTDCQVTFIGSARPMHKHYYRRCRDAAKNRHHFMGDIPRHQVLQELGNARVCISFSHEETPGISNLEAAALGCSLLLPDIEPIREYFGDLAEYLQSGKMDLTRLPQLVTQEPTPDLKKLIFEKYSEVVVKKIFERLTIPERITI